MYMIIIGLGYKVISEEQVKRSEGVTKLEKGELSASEAAKLLK